MPDYQISVRPHGMTLFLSVIASLLLLASITGQTLRFVFDHDHVYGLVQLFNVDAERNIPTFFTILLALSSALLLVMNGLTSQARAPRENRYWYALALGFVLIAYDEGFQVHEKLILPMRQLLGPGDLTIFYFSWVIPGIAIVCAVALLFMRFLLRLAPVMRRRLLSAAALYLGGCLGMEMLDGAYAETFGQNFTYSFLVTIEEGLEMAGLIMLIRALLNHLAEQPSKLALLPDTTAQLHRKHAMQPHLG